MTTQRILRLGALFVTAIAWAPGASAEDEKIENWRHSTWQMALKLDLPKLAPPAVQWAVLDKDPVPGFTARVKRMQGYYRAQIEQAKDEAEKEHERSSQMTVSWDLGFKEVTGDDLYLLTSVGDHGFSSNGPDGNKWIVTKIVQIKGKPVCWCIPVEVKTGKEIHVTLSQDNLFDLGSAFERAMRESGQAAQPATRAKTPAAAPPAKSAAQETSGQGEPLALDIARFYRPDKYAAGILKAFSGRQVIDGLPFEVGGQVRLYGQTPAGRGQKDLLETLKGIGIGRTFDELHLIHSTTWPDVEGETVAYVCLNYADGTKSILPIRYGLHLRDWDYLPSYEKDLPTDPDTKICWRHPPVHLKAPVRFFKSKFINPSPQKMVDTMDVVSARHLASYTLIAATVANRDPTRPVTPPPAAAEPKRRFDGKLVIHVVDDATGKPIQGALVDPSVDVVQEWLVGSPSYTSSAGKGTIRYPVKQTTRIAVSVQKEGYHPNGHDWRRDIPGTFTFRLTPTKKPAAVQGPSLIETLEKRLSPPAKSNAPALRPPKESNVPAEPKPAAASLGRAAEEILKLVPDSASGFVVINRIAAADAKVQALGQTTQLPLRSQLAKLKEAGIREGFDENGTVALLFLPPEGDGAMPTPILLVPVTNYGKFLQQLKPESATERVTKIEVLHTPAWARSIGGYAAITDMPHREVLEKTLKLSKEVPAALAPWRQWLAENDVAGVILQPGIKRVSLKVQEGIQMMKSTLAQGPEEAKAAAAVFDVYGKMFQAAEKEVSACGLGLLLDKQNVLRITSRTSLASGGEWARLLAQVHPTKENLLKGLPDGPFVVAGGGVVSDAVWEALIKFSAKIMETMQARKMPELSLQSMKGARALSMVLGVGKGNESIYSSAISVMRVDDAKAFMAGYEKYLKQYNEFIKGANNPMFQPAEVEESEVGGTPALQITMKAPGPPAGRQIPQYAHMMESFFGPGGKLAAWLVPADEHHVVMGYVSKERLQRTIEAIKQGNPGLASDAEVSKTAALLPRDALSIAYLSPQGTIDFIKRIMPAITLPEGKLDQKLPEFPKTPPIGLAVTSVPHELRMHLVVPAEVLQAIGQYAGKVMAMRSGASTARPQAQTASVPGEPLALDIARFYNMPSTQAFILEPFSGRQVVDGLPFEIRGQARLWGRTVAERNPKSSLPETLQGIRIDRTFDELHLIHHAMWPDAEGQTVAYICLNYADGTKFIFSIRYGVQVDDWYYLPSYEKELLTDTDTKICWRRPPVSYKAPVRLFKTRLINPFPQKVVETVDVVSARSLATYILIAATVASRDPARPVTPPPVAKEPEREFDGKLIIEVVDDATGKPIQGALVEPDMTVLDEGVVAAPFYTSSAGKGTIRYPVKETSYLSASVKKEGYLSTHYGWRRNIPDTFTFRLTPTRKPAEVEAMPSTSAVEAMPSPPQTGIVGPWRAASMVQNGQRLPEADIRRLLLVFSEKTVSLRVGPELVAETPYTIDAKAAPATIDMTFQGRVTAGVYQRKGNDLRICLNDVGKGRPKAIPADLGTGCDVDILLRRADLQWNILHVMNPDGSNPRVLVTHPEYTSAGSPEWSWDSRKLAFDAWRSIYGETHTDDPQIFTCNADGTQLKNLGTGAMPSWSPDGKRLTFSCYQPRNAVWIMNADGTGRELLDAGGWGAEWWPKGDKIAYTVYDDGGNIRVRDLDKGTSRDLLDGRYQQIEWGMAWSPDGQWLAFKGISEGKSELAVVHAEGMKKGFRVLLPKALPEVKTIGQPFSWSPDSKQVLATLKTKSNPLFQLYLIDADGKAPAKLLPGQTKGRSYTNMAWSPDGKYVAYCSPPDAEHRAEAKTVVKPSAALFQDEPAAHALYNQMVQAMRKANSLSYVSHYEWEAEGRVLGDCTYRVWLKKPNYFRVETESASRGKGGILIGDGSNLWIHWPQGRPHFYEPGESKEEAEAYEKTRLSSYMKKPAALGRHSIGHETGLLGAGMSMPIIDPSTFHGYTDSLQEYLDGVKSLGTEKVGTEDCDEIEVSIMKHQRSWYLWLSKGDHLPRKLKEIIRVSYDIVKNEEWSSVTLNADIPETIFAWEPPEGWQQWRLPDPEERLLKPGTKAPDFELASADGKQIKLSDYRGQVVWLNIWRAG